MYEFVINVKLLQRLEGISNKIEPIFSVDQVACCIDADASNSAQLTHMIRWHYLPTSMDKKTEEKVFSYQMISIFYGLSYVL